MTTTNTIEYDSTQWVKSDELLTYVMPHSVTQGNAVNHALAFPQRLHEVHGDKIMLSRDAVYHGSVNKLQLCCASCGYIWDATPNNLINKSNGCRQCAINRSRDVKPGAIKYNHASPDEKNYAYFLYKEKNWSYTRIAKFLGRSTKTICRWLDPEHARKDREYSAAAYQRNSSNHSKRMAAYRQSVSGKEAIARSNNKRRSLEYHCADYIYTCELDLDILQPEYVTPDKINPEYFECYDMFQEYVKGDKQGVKIFSFVGADEETKNRRRQQEELAQLSGEAYSLEHLIPLSKGGTHQPENFANRALVLNTQKNNSLIDSDTELFCRRIFNIN